MKKSTIIVSFSSKKGGNCEHIAEFIQTAVGDSINTYRFTDLFIHPCGNCQYECFRENLNCPHIGDMEYTLLDELSHCEKVYFIVTNYCDYPCANFFIFNERSQCYFQKHSEWLERYLNIPKRFIVVSNSKAESFRQAFIQHTNKDPEILWLSAKCYGKQSIAGDILESEEAQIDVLNFI